MNCIFFKNSTFSKASFKKKKEKFDFFLKPNPVNKDIFLYTVYYNLIYLQPRLSFNLSSCNN